MKVIGLANISSGFHTGNPNITRRSVSLLHG
ncbi:hypothetical protein ACQYRI_07805 [Salmonella enterica]